MNKQILFPIIALCILVSAIYLTVVLISPPAPLPADAPATEFSAGRAMRDLAVIGREPHPMGVFPAHAAVRDYLLSEIRALGLEPEVQKTFGLRVVSPQWILGGGVELILVRLRGTNPEGAILLIAHYDSTPGGPGAADNGAGVVTFLEILRALHAGPALRQDVIFLFTDGHEPGIIGTHAFTAQHPWSHDVQLVINLDTVKAGSPALAQTSQRTGLWAQALARSAARPAYVSLPFYLFPGGDSDLIPFRQAGVAGASFGTLAASQEVHTALDRPDIVSAGSVQQAGNQLLGLVRYLGDQPTLASRAPDHTFFPVLGRLIHYPVSWATPLAVIAGLCFLGTLLYGFRGRSLTWKGMGLGCLALLFGLACSVTLAAVIWRGIQTLHPDYAYSAVRPHLSDDALYAIGFFVLALAVITTATAVARKHATTFDLAAGALVVWVLGSIATTVMIPETSYLVTWVLLIGSLALLLAMATRFRKGAWAWSGIGFLLSAILVTFLWLPVVYTSFLGSSFPLLWMVVGLAAAWLGAMLPALDWISRPKPWLLPATALIVSLGLLLAGHYLVGKNSPPPLVNSIGYWQNADGGQAYWVAFIGGYRTDARTIARFQVAFPAQMDERQTRLLVNPVRRPYTELFPQAPEWSVLTSEAPLLALDGPRLAVLADEWQLGRRELRVRVTTSMHDRIWIIIPQETPLLAIAVPNNERTELTPVAGRECRLRFDGIPAEGFDLSFVFDTAGPIQLLAVEEKTGLPSFPGLSTQPEPGTMRSPGEFYQGEATDFTAIYRRIDLPAAGGE